MRPAACVVAAVMLLTTTACASGGGKPDDAQEGGPLAVPRAHGWSDTLERPGAFTDGLEILRTTGDDAVVTIRDVELLGADGVEMVGAMIAPPPRPYAAEVFIPRWPPRYPRLFDAEDLVDAEGAVVGPARGDQAVGWELLLGMRLTRPGVAVREGIRITYEHEGELYVADFPAEAVVCSDASFESPEGRCER